MNQVTSQNRDSNKSPYPNEQEMQKRRTVVITTLIVSAFVIGTTLAAVVVVCRVWLDVPKDTEVGVMAVVATVTLFAVIGQIVVTALQWRVAGDQWQAMKEGMDLTRDLFSKGERAYIGLDDIVLKGPITANEKPELIINLINGGKTPAERLEVSYAHGVGTGWNDDDQRVIFEDAYESVPVKLVLPGHTGIVASRKSFTSDEIDTIAIGLLLWYIKIEASYWDVQNIRRDAEFAAVFTCVERIVGDSTKITGTFYTCQTPDNEKDRQGTNRKNQN